MATFNTAFGALQTPQDVANRSMQPSGGIRIDRMVNQQMPSLPGQQQLQAQMQTQQQRQQQPAQQQQTFAQMQQAGQARPAPAAAYTAIPMRQQPVLLQQLGQSLATTANSTMPGIVSITGEPTFTPSATPQPTADQFVGQTPFPVAPGGRTITYTPPGSSDTILADREGPPRTTWSTPSVSADSTITQAVRNLPGTVGGYRGTATRAEAARTAQQAGVYGTLGQLSRPFQAPTDRDEPAKLGATPAAPRRPAPAAPVTIAPIQGTQTPGTLEGVRQSMARGVSPELTSMAAQAAQRQAAASAAAATQGMGAVPTTKPIPFSKGGDVDIFRPEAYTPDLPEGFTTPSAVPEFKLGPTRARPVIEPTATEPMQPFTQTQTTAGGATSSPLAEQLRQTLQQQMQGIGQTQAQTPRQPVQQQTFAQAQQAGQARPAPQMQAAGQAPMFGGSPQAQQMRQQLQQQLGQFAQAPTRFDTAAFQQLRAAQQGMLGQEFAAQQQALNEEMARRGLSASSIAAGRFGDLAGQQALAQAQIDAQLLQEAARTQAEDRANLLLQMSQFAELSGAQDLAQYQAQLAGQQQQFAQGIAEAGVTGQYGGAPTLAGQELGLRAGELTGQIGGAQTLSAQQLQEQQRQFDIQQQLQQTLGLGELGISQQQVDLRAQELQQQALSEGRSLSIEEARLEAQREQFQTATAEQQYQFDVQQQLAQALGMGELEVSQRNLDLRAEEIRQQAEQAGRSLNIEEARAQAQQEQFVAQLEEQRAGRLQNYGITQQQLNQEAQRIQQAERGLSLEEARDQAEVGFRAQQLMQQDRTIGLEEARFVAGAELERDKYNAQREQFRQTLDEETRQFESSLEEQRAQRLQNFNISQTQLDQEAYRLQQQDRTLDLQDARDRAEVGIRTQQLMQQDRSLDLQEARERAQEEIAIASLAEETAARVERDNISRDDLRLREEQVRYDFALRGEEIDDRRIIAEAEFQLQRERIAADYAMQGRDLNSREVQAEIERQTRKYIADQSTNLSYEKIQADTENFKKEIDQRKLEAEVRERQLNYDLLVQIANLIGVVFNPATGTITTPRGPDNGGGE
jgi:hypothetical protein